MILHATRMLPQKATFLVFTKLLAKLKHCCVMDGYNFEPTIGLLLPDPASDIGFSVTSLGTWPKFGFFLVGASEACKMSSTHLRADNSSS